MRKSYCRMSDRRDCESCKMYYLDAGDVTSVTLVGAVSEKQLSILKLAGLSKSIEIACRLSRKCCRTLSL